jgi:hypothetical protein
LQPLAQHLAWSLQPKMIFQLGASSAFAERTALPIS